MTEKKYFGTDGIRGKVGEYPITPDFFLKLGWALGQTLKNLKEPSVLIGKDTRLSGYMLETALASGLTASGVHVYFLGPIPTPAVAALTQQLQAHMGIVISASHNPYPDNGIKCFDSFGNKISDEKELEVEKLLQQEIKVVDAKVMGRNFRLPTARADYIDFCKQTAPDLRLKGLKIALDCAHGATYHVAPVLLKELGADIVSIGVQPNGFNINEKVGSTNISTLAEFVLKEKANLGIAYDGDGDRLIMVDEKGEVLDGDDILFIIVKHYQALKKNIGGVVGTLMSNLGLEQAINKMGLPFERVNVGDRYVLSKLQEQDWILGGETSGHILCLDKVSTGDGIASSLQVLEALQMQGGTLSELRQGWTKLPQVMVNVKTKKMNGQVLNNERIKTAVAEVEHELQNSGRVVLRSSGTEPVVRVMVEGTDHEKIKALANRLASVVTEVAGA